MVKQYLSGSPSSKFMLRFALVTTRNYRPLQFIAFMLCKGSVKRLMDVNVDLKIMPLISYVIGCRRNKLVVSTCPSSTIHLSMPTIPRSCQHFLSWTWRAQGIIVLYHFWRPSDTSVSVPPDEIFSFCGDENFYRKPNEERKSIVFSSKNQLWMVLQCNFWTYLGSPLN